MERIGLLPPARCPGAMTKLKVLPWAVAAVLSSVFFCQGLAASLEHSLTWDEPSFISAGYACLTQGEFRFNSSHPPLLQAIEAAPLLAMDLRVPRQPYQYWAATGNAVVAFGRAFLFDSGNDVVRIAFWSRLPILLLGALLVVAVYAWGRRLYGPWPALLGASLCALCPNLIGHAGVATEDLGCSALMLASAWTFWLAYRDGSPWRWARCGAVTGLALISKYTALVLLPAFATVALVCIVRGHRLRSRREWALGLLVLGATAFAVIGVAYGPRLGWPPYLRGLGSIYSDLQGDYQHYFAGSFSSEARWYFTVTAFVLKVSGGALLLLLWACVTAIRSDKEDALFLLVPAAAVVVASFFDTTNLGLRRILPCFPFLFLFASRILAVHQMKRGAVTAALLLVAWVGIETVRIFPDHLSYFSALAGGPEVGPYWLDDSNVDWGQDLPALARWQRRTPGADQLRLAYFGTARPSAYAVRAQNIESPLELVDPAPGLYAISAHVLVRLRQFIPQVGPKVDWLTRYQPLARAGHSIYIYRIP